MTSELRRRLLLLLLVPLFLLSVLNTWFDLRSAGNAAVQQDRQLLSLVPLLADSILTRGDPSVSPPVLLKAPVLEEFLNERRGIAAFAVLNLEGNVLVGDGWLYGQTPSTREPEFSSEEYGGATYRIVSQRVKTNVGDLIVRLADGSDSRQQWRRLIWVKVVLPNLVLVIAAIFAVNWAVRKALRPLIELEHAVKRRSPRDLTALDAQSAPDEVRPLVLSLNRLFGLVNAQAESQRRFVADAAHQLRTPLAALQAQVEAWAQVADAELGRQQNQLNPAATAVTTVTLSVDQIFKLRHAARRTTQLANQLLALSRADAHSARTQPMQRVDLKQLCEVLLEAHLDAATAKNMDIGLEAEAVHVMGHEWLLRELLSNLVDNAIKYTPPGGRVTLRCGIKVSEVSGTPQPFLEVEDDGPGVPATERTRMLERFYRVPGTVGEGTGLGLAIAEEIAHAHHSHLVVSSGSAGRGLRVAMWLSA